MPLTAFCTAAATSFNDAFATLAPVACFWNWIRLDEDNVWDAVIDKQRFDVAFFVYSVDDVLL
jgi:hypothetical protein